MEDIVIKSEHHTLTNPLPSNNMDEIAIERDTLTQALPVDDCNASQITQHNNNKLIKNAEEENKQKIAENNSQNEEVKIDDIRIFNSNTIDNPQPQKSTQKRKRNLRSKRSLKLRASQHLSCKEKLITPGQLISPNVEIAKPTSELLKQFQQSSEALNLKQRKRVIGNKKSRQQSFIPVQINMLSDLQENEQEIKDKKIIGDIEHPIKKSLLEEIIQFNLQKRSKMNHVETNAQVEKDSQSNKENQQNLCYFGFRYKNKPQEDSYNSDFSD